MSSNLPGGGPPATEDRASTATRTPTGELLAIHGGVGGPNRIFAYVREGLRGPIPFGAIQTLVVLVLGAACSLLVQALLARTLGVSAYGAYLFALAAMNAAILVGKLELDTGAIRYVGSYAGSARWALLRGFVQRSRVTVLTASALASVIGASAIWLLRGWLSTRHPSLPSAMWFACALLPPTALLLLSSSTLQGLGRYVSAQLPGQVFRPITMIALILIWRVGANSSLTPSGAVAVNLLATLLALFLVERAVARHIPVELAFHAPAVDMVTWRRTMYGLFVVSVSQFLVSQSSDVIIVGAMLGTRESGLYGAVVQLATIVDFGHAAVGFVAAPLIADLFTRSSRAELQTLVRNLNRINAILCIPLAILILAAGNLLLRLYGPSFLEAQGVLVVLVLSQLVSGLMGTVAGYLLTMTGHHRAAAWIVGGSALLGLFITLVFTPLFGIMGTATATLIATLLRALALEFYIRRHMGLRLFTF